MSKSPYECMPPRDEIIARLNNVKTQKNAAASYGISMCMMRSWLELKDITRSDYNGKSGNFASKCPPFIELVDARNKLKTNREVGRHFGVDRRTVEAWYKKHGIQGYKRECLEPSDIPLIRQLQDHLSAVECGFKFDVASRTIRDVWNGKSWRHIA